MNRQNISILLILFLCVLPSITSCYKNDESKSSLYQWQYEDLRVIDPPDLGIPNLDIISVYIADSSKYLRIRIDLLDIATDDSQDIFITIDFRPGGSDYYPFDNTLRIPKGDPWDIAIDINSDNGIRGYDSWGKEIIGLQASIFTDIFLDTVVVNISKIDLIPKGSPLDVNIVTLDPSTGIVMDFVTSIKSISVPPSPANVVLGFWNTFHAYTPAQALRSWDGAHSGPLSSRHGLRHLIDAAEMNGQSVVLCDVDDELVKVAMEFLGVSRGVVFGGASVGVSCFCGNGYTQEQIRPTDNTLSIETRMKIVDAALTGSTVFLGGDLTQNLWGSSAISKNLFNYIKEHPWMNILTSTDIRATKIDPWNMCHHDPHPLLGINPILNEKYVELFNSSPDNVLKELASQTYKTLLSPANRLEETLLEIYFGQLGHILSASEWMAKPVSISRCDLDLDWDGINECILASESIYLTFEINGGYLAFAFYRENDTVHQIIGPMYEVVVGLGDPIAYKPEEGVFADANLLPGALAIKDHIDINFKFKNTVDTVEMSNEASKIIKTYRIFPGGLQIKWSFEELSGIQIPLILDPWLRYEQDWSNQYSRQDYNGIWTWGIKDQFKIIINTPVEYQLNTFLDSKSLLNQPEDPNLEYPIGHYLPFPTAILNFSPSESAYVNLNFVKP